MSEEVAETDGYVQMGSYARTPAYNSVPDHGGIFEDMITGVAVVSKNSGPPIPENLQKAAEETMKEFNIRDYTRQKITVRDVLTVGVPSDIEDDVRIDSNHQQILALLKRLFLLDSKSRNRDVGRVLYECNAQKANDSQSDSNTDSDDDNDGMNMNPLDFLIVVFLASEPSLHLALANKLFQCRLAIPLVIPNFLDKFYEILMIPFTNITLDNFKEESKSEMVSALEAPGESVAFVKFKNPNISKSDIINHMLDPAAHPTFVHWNSVNGSVPRKLSDGVIEASWFIPKKVTEKENLRMYLNMRGDVLKFRSHLSIISRLSQVIVCFLSENDTSDETICSTITQIPSTVRLVVVIVSSNKPKIDQKSFWQRIKREKRTCPIVKHYPARNITDFITDLKLKLNSPDNFLRLAEGNLKSLFTDDAWATDMRRFAVEFTVASNIMREVMDKSKEELFIMQGDNWSEWSCIQKRCHRDIPEEMIQDNRNEFDIRSEYNEQLARIELSQQKSVINMSNGLNKFFAALLLLSRQSKYLDRHMFLHFLNKSLNANCSKVLPNLYGKLSDLQMTLRKSSLKSSDHSFADTMKGAQKDIQSSSVGLEHFFREMAHVYTASLRVRSLRGVYGPLPPIVAQLVIDGLPFELIDGDVSNIPLVWVIDVLKCIRDILKNKRLVVIAVLGIQSSGKSTLLNTMFGLQFAVSAGRCTKGVYMQMVAAEKGMPFDYALVLDTEGLRSAELDQKTGKFHDNELATFVIGISDVIMINIKGENYSEMRDVMQIAVTAFFRMAQVHRQFNMNKRCLFVHQNVPAANAKDQNLTACRNLQDYLDEMTRESAKQESIVGIDNFNQIIKFDCTTDIFFFPDLYQDTPPMGYVKSAYSEAVFEVKKSVLLSLRQMKGGHFKVFQVFIDYLRDLWEAILKENFVFCFKNCMEIRIHHELDSKCRELLSGVREDLVKWEKDQADQAESFSSNTKRAMVIIRADLDSVNATLVGKFAELLSEFCIHHIHSATMNQWLKKKQALQESEIEACLQESLSRVHALIVDKKHANRARKDESSHKKVLAQRALSLAESLSESDCSNYSIKAAFDELWVRLAPVTTAHDSADTIKTITDDISRVMYEQFYDKQAISREIIDKLRLNHKSPNKWVHIRYASLKPDFISVTDAENSRIYDANHVKWKEGGKSCLAIVNENMSNCINTFLAKDASTPYSITSIQYLFTLVLSCIEGNIIDDDVKVQPLPFFRIFLAGKAAEAVFPFLFDKNQKTFNMGPEMNEYRARLWHLFSDTVNRVGVHKSSIDHICARFKNLVTQHLTILLPSHMRRSLYEEIRGKRKFLKFILVTLAEKGTAEDYLKYFANPRDLAADLIQSYVCDILKDNHFVSKLSSSVMEMLKRTMSEMDSLFNTQDIQVSTWVNKFWESAESIIFQSVITAELSSVPSSWVIKDVQSFNKEIKAKLETIVNELIAKISSCDLQERGLTRKWIETIVYKFWGCSGKCPFCGEPCQMSANNHFEKEESHHRCLQHRPDFIIHGHKVEGKRSMALYGDCYSKVATKKIQFKLNKRKHKFCNYHKYHSKWIITPKTELYSCTYWKYVIVKFPSEMSQHFHFKVDLIPRGWDFVNIEEAKESLDALI